MAEAASLFRRTTLYGRRIFRADERESVDRVAEIRASVRRALPTILVLAVISVVTAALGFAYFYNHYAAVVEQRVRSGFWHTRAGVYAAPYRIRKGRRASLNWVVDRLKRAGYVEGPTADGIWSGSFTVTDNKLYIRPNPGVYAEPEPAKIVFTGSRISAIEQDGRDLDEFAIEPELLIGRTETKRTGAHALKFEEIPEELRNAIIAAEDQRFFSHYGIDPRGILRAFLKNVSEYETRQGGSTITQQLVKNTFLTPERSFKRKFVEAFLAIALERQMSKEQIFALYCNEIYLGQYGSSGVHGVEQAAQAYFGKELKELSLAEAAAIAAMIKNPNRFAPHKNEETAQERRRWIIERMGELGLITGEQVASAKGAELKLAPPKVTGNTLAPYFVDSATKDIAAKFEGDYLNSNFNLRVYTTIDTHLQSLAEAAAAEHLAKLDRIYAKKGRRPQAAIVAIDPHTGHVLAMVGGRDYLESQFNRATDALRQPGSTFKPFVYAAALERGYTPISLFSDRPTEFSVPGSKLYTPANYGNSYAMTNISMKTALAKSSNVAAVRAALETGLGRVAEKAADFGFTSTEAYPSLALGTFEVTPLQLAAGYAAFANGGRRVEPTFVDRIVAGDDGTLYISVPSGQEIIRPQTAYMITDMLDAVVERGTARRAAGALGKDNVFVGKTGSSKDGWFVGYTPNLVTVAWVGFDDNEDVRSTGGDIALPMWVDFMKAAVQSRPEYGGDNFPMPKGLTTAVVDPTTGMAAGPYCPMSEKVVVPASSVSALSCLLHRPQLDITIETDLATLDVEEPNVVPVEPAFTDRLPEEPVILRRYIDEAEVRETPRETKPKLKPTPQPGPKRKSEEGRKPSERIDEGYLGEYSKRIDQGQEQ